MANPCAPNTSEPKAGFASTLIFDGVKLLNFFTSLSMGWLGNVSGVVPSLTYDLPTFCAIEPPASFDWTDAAAVAAFFNPLNPTGAADLRRAIIQTFEHYLWYTVCQCSASPQPTPPSPISQPTGWEINPPTLTPNVRNTPCATGEVANFYGFTSGLDYNLGAGVANPPADSTLAVVHVANVTLTSPGLTLPFTLQAADVTGALFGPIVNYSLAPGQVGAIQYAWQPNQHNIHMHVGPATGTGTCRLYGTLDETRNYYTEMWCNGQVPGGTTQACCPPDPTLAAMLQQILSIVTMQQRYRLPFANIPAGVHSGLTGQGSFSIQGLLAMKLELTTLPAYLGTALGEPDYVFDAGWVSVLTGDGVIEEQRVHAALQVVVFESMPLATTFGYSLAPGVVMTATELAPEAF